jgi:hypothetical protein
MVNITLRSCEVCGRNEIPSCFTLTKGMEEFKWRVCSSRETPLIMIGLSL